MTEWRIFDTRSFLRSSKHWKEKKEKLQQELDNMSLLPSMDNTTSTHSGNISDLTGKIALRRLEIEAEIDKISRDEEMLRHALNLLTEDEKRLVRGFFFTNNSASSFVYDYGRNQGICKDYVYRDLNEVLKKMGDAILEKYYD